MYKKLLVIILGFFLCTASALAVVSEEVAPTYLSAVINTDEAAEIQKSTIFDASQSFIPYPNREVTYEWNFGDGNRNEGVEVLHTYTNPGNHTVTLTINDGVETSETQTGVFAYRKLIALITDQTAVEERVAVIQNFAERQGVYIKLIESFGSSTEFISEEVLTKKLTQESANLQKANEIIIWTKENAGLNALSRHIQSHSAISFAQKIIIVMESSVAGNITRIQRQFEIINPQVIIEAKEAAIYPLIESVGQEEFISTLERGGYEYEIITAATGKLRPWNFMSYFVNILINNGVPDNTIALLLLLPIIATVVVCMKQIIGITTFGIYTPSIITLSFLIIGIYAGLLTLIIAIAIGAAARLMLKKIRMLFIPKMAVVITIVSLTLFLVIIFSTYLGLFDSEFLSIAIFPMLILSTLVEKFISVKTEKGLPSALILMSSTVIVAIIAYLIVGGEINLGFFTLKLNAIKNIMMSYPELVFLLIIINIILGRWTGLRILERIRFREVLRHIEE